MRPAAKGFMFVLAVMAISAVSYGCYKLYIHKQTPAVQQTEESTGLKVLPSAHEVEAFEKFMNEYSRVYPSEEKKLKAFTTFVKNLRMIEQYNSENRSVKLEINDFADVEHHEFKSNKLGLKTAGASNFRQFNSIGTFKSTGVAVPDSVDWREKGAVTPVKNQGQCGSCWSFSTTGALEGRWQVATGKLCSLSEQQFVDCDTKNDHGCNGGLMDYAFTFAENHALCSEESFSYKGEDGTCPSDLETTCDVCIPKGSVTGFQDVESNSISAMKEALSQGPVSVAIEADQAVFQFYKKGVVTSAECGNQLDHGVLAVGYGSEQVDGVDTPYFLVKNSWGPRWGQDGYVKISAKLSESGLSECGILAQPSFPVVSKSAKAPAKNPFQQQQQQAQIYI